MSNGSTLRRWTRLAIAAITVATFSSRSFGAPPDRVDITQTNLAEYRELLPESMRARVEQGHYTLTLVPVDAAKFHANYTDRFWSASAANAGKYKIDAATGGLADAKTGEIPKQIFGLPFPTIDPNDPQAGPKIIHNYRLRKMQADGNLHEFELSDVRLDGEVLRTVKIFLSHKYYVGTTATPPASLPDNTESRQLAAALFPKDLEGVGVLTWRFNDWTTWDQVWAYLPTIRRVRRVRSSQRGDRIPGFEVQADDADCYDNKTSYFDWKLARPGEVIGPIGVDSPYAVPLREESATRHVVDFPYNNAVYETPGAKGAGWWTLKNVFIRRPVWIVEGMPKDPYYDSGKIVLYVDRELYHGYYKVSFTKAGELFRTNLCGQAWARTADGKFSAPSALLMMGVNEKENRGTPAGRYKRETFESGFDDEWFSATHLSKLSE